MMEIYRKYFLGRTNFLAETISLPAQYYTLLPVRPDPLFVVFLRQPIFDCAKSNRKNLLKWKQNNDEIARGTPRLSFCYMDNINIFLIIQTNLQKVHTQAKNWNTSNGYSWQIASVPLTQYLATNVLFTWTHSTQPYNWKISIQIRLKGMWTNWPCPDKLFFS